MIKFACQCKYEFEVPEELGGRQIQCPQCKLLVDVPTLADLAQLTDDGTYRLDTPNPAHDRFEELRQIYSKNKVDENGMEIDLRLSRDQIAKAGTNDTGLEENPIGVAPKYDPETGELIRPLDVRDDPSIEPHPSQIPMAHATLNYATPAADSDASLFAPMLELLMPINLAVMFFVFLAHMFLDMMVFSIYIAPFLILVVVGGLMAHYANVIEDIGVDQRNELPRFLRHFGFYDDILMPFCNVLLAFLYCFLPAILVHAFLSESSLAAAPKLLINLAMVMLGLVFFPSAVLTTTTSGTIMNLRPDRVIGTLAQIGARYAYFVVVLTVGTYIYYLGLIETLLVPMRVIAGMKAKIWFETPLAAYSELIIGIYLMHYFSWLIGLAYRRFQPQFPWVLQRHVRQIPGVNAPRFSQPAHEADTFGKVGKSG